MKVLQLGEVKTNHPRRPIIIFASPRIDFGQTLAIHLGKKGASEITVRFAVEDGQLFMQACEPSEDTITAKKLQSNSQYYATDKGIVSALLDMCKCPLKTARCLVGEMRADGWYPVITSSWKQLNTEVDNARE